MCLLTGCVTTTLPDGTVQRVPDYEMIEFGSVAVFTVIVNEVKVKDDVVLKAYRGLASVRDNIQCLGEDCPALDLTVVDNLLAEKLPLEYRALAKAGSRLIRSRVRQYVGTIDVPLEMSQISRNITTSVLNGALAAFEPKIELITKGLVWNKSSLSKDTLMLMYVGKSSHQEPLFLAM